MNLTKIRSHFAFATLCLAVLGLMTACVSTKVISPVQDHASLTKPKQILIYDFAVSPQEFKLDRGIANQLRQLVDTTPRSERELELGRKVAEALSKHLVADVGALGIPAVRATTNSIVNSETLLIKGQLVSLDQGNRRARAVIGLGMRRTDVRTLTQVYGVIQGQETLMDQFDIDAQSGRKLGGVKTMGAGAATERLATSTVLSSGVAVGSEAFADNVDADAARAARVIVRQLKDFYLKHGWIKKKVR